MQPSQRPADTIRPLLRVRQVREFGPEPVTQEALDAIADAARWSGSSQNSQPWRFIVIRDPETLRAIHELGAPSTRSLATATGALAIVMPERQGGGIALAYDEGRAAERTLIAAQLLGIGAGIAWLPSEVRPVVGERLGIPAGHFVRTVVALGHPLEAGRGTKSARAKARLPRSETVFEDRWPA